MTPHFPWRTLKDETNGGREGRGGEDTQRGGSLPKVTLCSLNLGVPLQRLALH